MTVLPKGIGPTEGYQLQRDRRVGEWCDGKSLLLFIAKLTPLRRCKLTSADFSQLYRVLLLEIYWREDENYLQNGGCII